MVTNDTSILVSSITITHSERLDSATFETWEEVDAVLRACAAQDHCSKTWYEVRWTDGKTWQDRFDLMPYHQFHRSILGFHIRCFAETHLLRRIIPTYTRATQEDLLRELGVTDEDLAEMEDLLARYDLGPVVTPDQEKVEAITIAAWKAGQLAERALFIQSAHEGRHPADSHP